MMVSMSLNRAIVVFVLRKAMSKLIVLAHGSLIALTPAQFSYGKIPSKDLMRQGWGNSKIGEAPKVGKNGVALQVGRMEWR